MNQTIHRLLWSFSAIVLFAWGSYAQNKLNVQLVSNLSYTQSAIDIWGYADSIGNEYALVTLDSGFSVVDITNPSVPFEEFQIPAIKTTWRDVKTWDHYAYVTHDLVSSTVPNKPEGLLIVDLDSLVNPHYEKVKLAVPVHGGFDTLLTSHNLYIDENGICYIFGSNVSNGGALMFDVAADPWNPPFVGMFDDHYLHDGMARNDTLWGAAVYYGRFLAIDVTSKMSPVIMGQRQTPNTFTHNCWISDDGKTLYTTDEQPGAFIGSYDVSNLLNITENDRIQRLPGTNVVPHNVHVYGDFLVTSYYTTGVHIVDAADPENMVEVGFYDTYHQNDAPTFHGNWGAYPYLPSGYIIASDRSNGLFVLLADYKRGSRIHGLVSDSLTGNPLINAIIADHTMNDSVYSALDGTFQYGREPEGWDTLWVHRLGYQSQKIAINFQAGQDQYFEIKLLPLGFSVDETLVNQLDIYPNPTASDFRIQWPESFRGKIAEIEIHDLSGKLVVNQSGAANSALWKVPGKSGMYILTARIDGTTFIQKLIVE